MGNGILYKADQLGENNIIRIPPGANQLSRKEFFLKTYNECVSASTNSLSTFFLVVSSN